MKIVILSLSVLILSVMFFTMSQHSYASTCAVKESSLTVPQFYLSSDSVFVGTVSSINNYTNHQWKVQFNPEKIWKGEQNSTITLVTSSPQACGYSLIKGEKYLVFANGSPLNYNPWATKPYSSAQSDIVLLNDPKFQSEEILKENLNKKLEAAKNIISNLMVSRMSSIPFNEVGVDVINSTLDIGIDSTKAILSETEYQMKIKEIVGDIPIKITFGQIVPDTGSSTNTISGEHSLSSLLLSPLKQFKSGISLNDIQCKTDFVLMIKATDNSPACVKPDTSSILIERGWAKPV